MPAEILVIKEIEGVGQNLLDRPGQFNASLGTSLNRNHFFSKNHIAMYVDWALEHCNNFLLLVDDLEERNNYMVFRGLEAKAATALALDRGQDIAKAYQRVLARYNSAERGRIHIIRTADLFQEPRCLDINSQLFAAFQEEPQFKQDVNNQVFTNIGSKVREWRGRVSAEDYTKGFPILARYILEEIGATIFLREHKAYSVEVYPGPSMQVVRNLYRGNYPNLSAPLGLKADYGYINLDIGQVDE